jgi:hypothetical protein
LCNYIKLNCILLTKTIFIVYLYSLIYFFQIYINLSYFWFKLIYISNITIIHSYVNYYLKIIISYFFRLLFIKLRFIGKGYKLLIRKNYLHHIILFNFGYSHRYYIYIYFFYMFQIAKTRFIFYGLNYFLLRIILQQLYLIKPINIFTLRGLRFAKQCIFKKIGKIGLYM